MKGYEIIMSEPGGIKQLLIGNAVAFVLALLAIKTLITFVNKYGFKLFGWYSIVRGIALLVIHYCFFKLTVI